MTNAASIFLNGTSSLTYSAASDTLAATDPFTIEFWYRSIDSTSSIVDLLDTRQSGAHNEGYFVSRDQNSGIRFFLDCDSGIMDFHGAAVSSTKNGTPSYDTSSIWHYVAITKNSAAASSAFSMYFDGYSQPITWSGQQGPISGNCSISSSTDSIRFGNDAISTSTSNSLTGNLDEVRIWSTDRSTYVTSTWNQELPATGTSLVGHWPFNNTATDVATNHASSGQSGIVSFVKSSPFGHFLYQNNGNAPGLYSSVTSTGSGMQMRWRYDLNVGDSDYTSAITTSTAAWNTLGAVTIASTTATSSMTLEILDADNSNSSTVWYGNVGLWVSKSVIPTSTVDHLYLNSYYLDGNDCFIFLCPYSDLAKKTVVMHELGHALGLDHSYWGSVMNYYSDKNNPVTTLQNQDTSDYYFVWGGNQN